MRVVLLALALALFSGCAAPDYYLTAESATYSYMTAKYNATLARQGLAAAGLDTRDAPSPTYVSATRHDISAFVASSANGTFELRLSFVVNEHTRTKERASERGNEISITRGNEAAAIVAAFEHATNWTHDAGPVWAPVTLHGD